MIDRVKYLERQRRYNQSVKGHPRARRYEDSERGAAMRSSYESYVGWIVRRGGVWARHPSLLETYAELVGSSRDLLDTVRTRDGLIPSAEEEAALSG